MDIVLATSNPHKLEEIAAVIADPRVRFHLLSELDPDGAIPEPVEDQPSFEGNAELKARYYAEKTGMLCLADDSGLEVDALGGAPGIRSARYSGVNGGRDVVDPANNRKLLEELAGVPIEQRTARFVCALCLAASPEADLKSQISDFRLQIADFRLPIVVRGTVEGRILLPAECADPWRPERGRGSNGFGYDPLFQLPPDHPRFPNRTTAELSPDDKNSLSHRGEASRLLWARLKPRLDRTAMA